jgi:Protein of unknown function (DUF2934)
MPKRATAAARAANMDLTGAVPERAYFRALNRGFAPGQELDDWLMAEREVAALLAATEPPARKTAAAGKKRKASR